MAATVQDSGEEGCEIMGVPQREIVGQQAETSRGESPKNNESPAEDSAPDGVQVCAGTDRGPGVENGAGVENDADIDNGPLDSSQDSSTYQQNLDESTSQQDDDACHTSGDLFDVPQGTSSGQLQKRTVRSRKNPTPRKVPTPRRAPSRQPAQPKKRGRTTKAETLPPADDQLTCTPALAPQNQGEAPEDQEATPTPQKKRCGRKPKVLNSPAAEGPLTGAPVSTSQNQQDATEEQEMSLGPEKKKPGRKPKGLTKPPTENLTSTPVRTSQNEQESQEEQTPSGRPKRRAAKVAMEYLHSLLDDLDGQSQSSERKEHGTSPVRSSVPPKGQAQTPAKQGRKRKTLLKDSSDASGDEDFVPDSGGETEEEDPGEDDDDDSVSSLEKEQKKSSQAMPWTRIQHFHLTKTNKTVSKAANGLLNHLMGNIWWCAAVTKKFREEHCASWVFPEWIPSAKDWHFLSESEAEVYLPSETQSPAFRISREGLKEDSTPCRIKRFESLPVHAERWDMCFFVGGPVWSMEWCPCPDGGTSSQFAAIYCNKGMDDRHKVAGTHSEPALLQLWDVGELQYDTRPSAQPQLAYAVALDYGCIWDMKWCPSSAWELPTTRRKVPQMARLGILAAAFSNGKIAVYSLPHPDSLTAVKKSQDKGGDSQVPLICKVQSVAILKVGSMQAGEASATGQCFCVDWLPIKPHNTLAAGFYDGSVSLWNLSTKSQLQRVRAPDGSVTLYPYHSFIAHDHIVQSLAWCRASSDLLATAGSDRKLKFWDLKKTYEPISIQRRYLSTEICWPLIWSGLVVAQECCYATYGQHGIHYLDAGYMGYKPYFMAPRRGTIWSTSFSDWLNSCMAADSNGDLIMILVPDLTGNPNSIKRTVDRRFPVVTSEMVPFPGSEREERNGPEQQTYDEAVKKYYLHLCDMDMRTFKNAPRRAPTKRMLTAEGKGSMCLDRMPLGSLFKVRVNPNLCSQSWVLSGGQTGLVRAHCIRAMNSAVIAKMVRESEAQFATMFSSQGNAPGQDAATAVRHSTESTVQVR